jgi:hypothetical protein
MSNPVRAAPSRAWVWRLIALILLVAIATLVAPRIISIGYPGEVTTPDVVGLVTSSTTDPDLTAHVVLIAGQSLTVGRSDRTLGGLGGIGDLQFVGIHPDRWYLAGRKSEKPDCYWIGASRAYSEPGAVMLAFEAWPGVGIRLPKAPGYDDSKLVTRVSDSRLLYSAIGPISLCSDEEGRINGRR